MPGFLDRGVCAPALDQTSVRLCAVCSRTASTWPRVTPGNHWRNCSTVAPSSRFSNRALTGTLVPLKVQAPPSLWEARSTASHRAQSSMVDCKARRRAGQETARSGAPGRRPTLGTHGAARPSLSPRTVTHGPQQGVTGRHFARRGLLGDESAETELDDAGAGPGCARSKAGPRNQRSR